MAFNYGTTAQADPRFQVQPRQVDGLTAYWNANRGQMMDYQTGNPLIERLSAMRANQAPDPNAYIYGDSYSGIQGVEENRARAAQQQAMQLAAMRQAAFERQQARADANDRSQLLNSFRNAQLKQADAYNRDRNDLARQNLELRYLAEQGKNDRADMAASGRYGSIVDKQNAKLLSDLDQTKQEGDYLAGNLGNAIMQYNQGKQDVDAAEQAFESQKSQLAPLMSSGRLVGNPFGYAAVSTKDAEAVAAAEIANRLAEQRQSARERSKAMMQDAKTIDSIVTNPNYKFDPTKNVLTHQQTGMSFPLQFPYTPQVKKAQAQPLDPETEYLNKFASTPQVLTGPAKLGGRYIK